jgi:hypothetical protein
MSYILTVGDLLEQIQQRLGKGLVRADSPIFVYLDEGDKVQPAVAYSAGSDTGHLNLFALKPAPGRFPPDDRYALERAMKRRIRALEESGRAPWQAGNDALPKP